MPPVPLDEQIRTALALLPESGEIDFDSYKASLYSANPDNGKVVFTNILKGKLANRRLEVKNGTATVYLSRKVAS